VIHIQAQQQMAYPQATYVQQYQPVQAQGQQPIVVYAQPPFGGYGYGGRSGANDALLMGMMMGGGFGYHHHHHGLFC
jgi:hypothetical protein